MPFTEWITILCTMLLSSDVAQIRAARRMTASRMFHQMRNLDRSFIFATINQVVKDEKFAILQENVFQWQIQIVT